MPEAEKLVQLAPPTLAAFTNYIQEAELAMQPCLRGETPFLWSELKPEVSKRIGEGEIAAELWSGKGPTHVADGLIHDWIGAIFAAGATVAETLAVMQDYEHHADIYKPDVIGSRVLSHEGNEFQIALRLRKKKTVTVVLDTWHDVHYEEISATRWTCRSWTTSIREVQNAGTPKEMVSEADAGNGYLWRLNSYWNIQALEAGVWLECRAISLTRDIPKGLAWIIEPIVRKLPRESLVHTLQATRQALSRLKGPPMEHRGQTK